MSKKDFQMHMQNILLSAMLSLGLISCSELDDIPYQPHMPINESHSFEGYDFFSIDAEKEWTWMTDRKALKEVAYPIPHNEHPSHKKMDIYGDYVVEKKGKLKYVKHPLISNYQYPAIIKSVDIPTAYIDIVKTAKAYWDNRYNIQDDPNAEQLEWMLGLRKEYKNKLVKSQKTGNPLVDDFQNELGNFVNSLLNPSISNWIEQISNDGDLSREDCKFLYAIERHDETSFDYIYLNHEGKSSYTVRKFYKWDYEKDGINDAASFTNLYEAIKNSIRYQLVETSTRVSIDLYPEGDESLLSDNYQVEEAIFKYKFNDTYNYPDGFTGFEKNIRQVLLNSFIKQYENACEQFLNSDNYKIELFNALDGCFGYPIRHYSGDVESFIDSIYKKPIINNPETGKVGLGLLGGQCGGLIEGMVPDRLKDDNQILCLNIYMTVNGEQIKDVWIEVDESLGYGPDGILYRGNVIEINTLGEAIRKGITLMPKKEGIISIMSFPVYLEVASSYVDNYIEWLQNSVRVYLKEMEKAIKKAGEGERENIFIENIFLN